MKSLTKLTKEQATIRSLIAGTLFLVLAVAIFCFHFMRQKITAVADLETVQGPLQHYSFRDGFKGSHSYYIFLEGDERRYQIPANFLGCFDRDGFESTVAAGDILKISFNKRFFVFSISDSSRSFMAAESAIAAYNNSEDLWVGTFFSFLQALSSSWC